MESDEEVIQCFRLVHEGKYLLDIALRIKMLKGTENGLYLITGAEGYVEATEIGLDDKDEGERKEEQEIIRKEQVLSNSP